MNRATRGLAWLVVFLALLPATGANAVPSLYVDPPVTGVWNGDHFWVDIAVSDEVAGITGYDLLVDFDESIIDVVEVLEGPLPQSAGPSFFFWTQDPAQSNAIVMNGAVLGNSVDGPGVVARIHFVEESTGVSPVEFAGQELRDIENAPIAVDVLDGQVQVVDPPTIYLTPSLTETYEGTTFFVDVAVNGTLTDLTGYNLRIALDPSVVQFVGAEEGPLPPSGGADTYFFWAIEGASSDTLVINGAVLGDWVDGPGVLATIEFSALYQGVTDVEFTFVDLRDIENSPLIAFSEDAVVVVLPGGTATEERSWGEIKSLFR